MARSGPFNRLAAKLPLGRNLQVALRRRAHHSEFTPLEHTGHSGLGASLQRTVHGREVHRALGLASHTEVDLVNVAAVQVKL